MKKLFRSIVEWVLIASLVSHSIVFSSVIALSPQPILADPTVSADEALWEHIKEIRSYDPDCTWNETTEVASVRTMYDYDYNINGYLYSLSTDGKATGYIHLFWLDNSYTDSVHSYTGVHYVEKNIAQLAQTQEGEQYDLNKVIYLGVLSYWVKSFDRSKVYNLYNGARGDDSEVSSDLRESYERLIDRKRAARRESQTDPAQINSPYSLPFKF